MFCYILFQHAAHADIYGTCGYIFASFWFWWWPCTWAILLQYAEHAGVSAERHMRHVTIKSHPICDDEITYHVAYPVHARQQDCTFTLLSAMAVGGLTHFHPAVSLAVGGLTHFHPAVSLAVGGLTHFHPAVSNGAPAQLTTEARDNLKFLATLERHLGILEAGELPAVLDAIPPLLNGLRLARPSAQSWSAYVDNARCMPCSGINIAFEQSRGLC